MSSSFKKGLHTSLQEVDINYYDLGEEIFSNDPQLIDKLVVGRDSEAELLGSYLGNCKKKIRKRIIIYGERGIGKSTLTKLLTLDEEVTSLFCIIEFDQINYLSNLDEFKKEFLVLILRKIIETMTKRDEREASIKTLKNWVDVLSDATITKKSFSEVMSKLDNETDEWKFWINVLNKIKRSTILIFDDYQDIHADNPILSFVTRLVSLGNLDNIISIFIMQKKAFESLTAENSILLKDAYILPIEPLSTDYCCELIGKRIRYHRTQDYDELDKPLDWNKDILPFVKSGLEQIAIRERGNALDFVNKAGDVYSYAMKKKLPLIDQDASAEFYKEQGNKAIRLQQINLSEKQTQIYLQLLDSKEGLTGPEIAQKINTGRSNAVQHLTRLLLLGLVYSKRYGRNQKYFPVLQDSVNKSSNNINRG